MTEKLNPCPFCGAIPRFFGDDSVCIIRCSGCSVMTGQFYSDKRKRKKNAQAKAAAFWNNGCFNWIRSVAP